jgi:hypothetical protein
MAQYGSAIWAKRDSSGLQLGDEPPLVIDQNIGASVDVDEEHSLFHERVLEEYVSTTLQGIKCH